MSASTPRASISRHLYPIRRSTHPFAGILIGLVSEDNSGLDLFQQGGRGAMCCKHRCRRSKRATDSNAHLNWYHQQCFVVLLSDIKRLTLSAAMMSFNYSAS